MDGDWLHSKGDQMIALESGLPMMAQEEIDIIDGLITQHQPEYCLEWGSGNSTIYFSKHPSIKSWISIDHNGHYVEYLSQGLDKKVTIMWVNDDQWYVDCIKHSRPKFDFILVDGMQRERCLEAAISLLTPHGTLLLHDSDRPEYQPFLSKYRHEKLCPGEKKIDGGCAHRGLARIYELL